MEHTDKTIKHLVVDTTAFIQNAPLQNIAEKAVTCQEVMDEIKNKPQLRRLIVLPYDLEVKNVFPESIRVVTEMSKKTGDYPSLSATDIKVMALTYQLEKEHVGIEHIHTEPVVPRTESIVTTEPAEQVESDLIGFYWDPEDRKSVKVKKCKKKELSSENENKGSDNLLNRELTEKFGTLQQCNEGSENKDQDDGDWVIPRYNKNQKNRRELENDDDDIQAPVIQKDEDLVSDEEEDDGTDDDAGLTTPQNINDSQSVIQEKNVTVACITTDFAMQNVLRQMNLNVAALDGRIITQLRTFILRCYACFKTTSVMTKQFCPKCGNKTLKKVAYSLDENGKMKIHINGRRPLTGRGKKFSLPTFKGGKHPNNPIIAPDQPMPHNELSRVAKTKLNPLDEDYIAGFSPFATRDTFSRSAQLGIKPGQEKYWMRRNPNEARRKRK